MQIPGICSPTEITALCYLLQRCNNCHHAAVFLGKILTFTTLAIAQFNTHIHTTLLCNGGAI